MRRTCYYFIFICLFVTLTGCNEKVETKNQIYKNIYFDPVIDKTAPPKSLPFVFDSRGKMLSGRALLASGNYKKPLIIFLHGIPGFEKNEDICQFLRRNGFNVVLFSYTGSWGNPGSFSFDNCKIDILELHSFLMNNSKKYDINKDSVYLCGYSMGADLAILSAQEIKTIKSVIAISPWNATYSLSKKSDKELKRYKKGIEQTPCISITSGDMFVNEILENDENDVVANYNKSKTPVKFIFSNQEEMNSIMSSGMKIEENFSFVIDACDHQFSDKRNTLSETIQAIVKNDLNVNSHLEANIDSLMPKP